MVTLEISSNEIRLMEVDGGRVTQWASRSLEADMFEEGVIQPPQATEGSPAGSQGGQPVQRVSSVNLQANARPSALQPAT